MTEIDRNLCAYVRRVLTLPSLSPFQLRCLFQELELGGPQAQRARARLVEVNLRLAVSVARKYRGRGLPLFDLIQESNVGLLCAVDRYNWRTDTAGFTAYATWWMRMSIETALEHHSCEATFQPCVESDIAERGHGCAWTEPQHCQESERDA
jgi:DNA-directed RNA polymerase sigma subunit (sigma70/sigma32)